MNIHKHTAFFSTLLVLAFLPLPGKAQNQDPPKRSITPLSGNLYWAQNNIHFTVFLVTPDGIILADPINVAGMYQLILNQEQQDTVDGD